MWIVVALIVAATAISSVWLLTNADDPETSSAQEITDATVVPATTNTTVENDSDTVLADVGTVVTETVTETTVETEVASDDEWTPSSDYNNIEWGTVTLSGNWMKSDDVSDAFAENVLEAYEAKYTPGKNPNFNLFDVYNPDTGKKQDLTCNIYNVWIMCNAAKGAWVHFSKG